MRSGKSYRVPVCTIHGSESIQKNDVGEWVCIQCFDAFLQQQLGNKSVGGVELPTGVRDIRRPSIKDAMVNRRWRRHAK